MKPFTFVRHGYDGRHLYGVTRHETTNDGAIEYAKRRSDELGGTVDIYEQGKLIAIVENHWHAPSASMHFEVYTDLIDIPRPYLNRVDVA